MRHLITILLLVLTVHTARAMCGGATAQVWPSGKTLSPNPVILIDVSGNSSLIHLMGTRYHAMLCSGNDTIPLTIAERFEGQFSASQALFRPERALQKRQEYELFIQGLENPLEMVYRMDPKGNKLPVRWNVSDETDLVAPQWTQQTSYKDASYMSYGCGPAVSMNFNLQADPADVLVRTTVTNKLTGKMHFYYLHPEDGQLSVGHGMCSGAFVFEPQAEYDVCFCLVDASGNKSDFTCIMTVASPIPERTE